MPLPKSSTMMLRHEPTLIATTRSRMTASSPRGTFSQAELTADRVITRCITRPVSAPRATIRPMPGDLEPLPARISPAVSGAGPAVLAAELLARVRAELRVIGELGERDQILLAAWLTRLRSARTHRAYAGDVAAWLGWLAERDTGTLAAGRVHVDLRAATQLDEPELGLVGEVRHREDAVDHGGCRLGLLVVEAEAGVADRDGAEEVSGLGRG
jgi:hypothetical protein